MKQAVLTGKKSIEIREIPVPAPDTDEVLIRVAYCGICTLEQRLFRGDMKIYYPIVPGHEISGEVVKIGDAARTALTEGDKVAVDRVYRCHECYFCRKGESNLCEKRFSPSISPLGGFSEFLTAQTTQVHKIGERLSLEEAVFVEPLACCIRSLKKVGLVLAEDLLILGAGPMGLMHLQAARLMGARVFVSDIDERRLELALEMGADGVFNPARADIIGEIKQATENRGVDCCIVTSPAPAALADAFKAVRKNGRITIYTAYVGAQPEIPIDLNTIHRSEILITGSEGRTELDFQQALKLLSFGKIDVQPLISRIFPLSRVEEAIAAASSQATERVLLEIQQEMYKEE